MACCLTAPSHYLNQCWLIISDIHIRTISQEMPQPSITKICLKITCLKFHSNFPGANELMCQCTHCSSRICRLRYQPVVATPSRAMSSLDIHRWGLWSRIMQVGPEIGTLLPPYWPTVTSRTSQGICILYPFCCGYPHFILPIPISFRITLSLSLDLFFTILLFQVAFLIYSFL